MLVRNPIGVAFDLIEPVFWVLARRHILADFVDLKYGNCCFSVLPDHRDIVDEAMSSLKNIDKKVYSTVTDTRISFFYEGEKNRIYECPINKRFHIKNWMIREEEEKGSALKS